jgi:hypothetical protein
MKRDEIFDFDNVNRDIKLFLAKQKAWCDWVVDSKLIHVAVVVWLYLAGSKENWGLFAGVTIFYFIFCFSFGTYKPVTKKR